MALKLITAPTVEPVSLDEAKEHMRVDGDEEDALIQGLIATARLDVETISLHALITQTWDLFLDCFPSSPVIELPLLPLQSVTGIYYTPDSTGVEATFDANSYRVDIYNKPGKIVLKRDKSWPGDQLIEINGVRIRFVCGFGDSAGDVDARAIQAVKLLLGHYYENREAVFMGRTSPALLPQGVSELCMDLRMSVMRW